MSEFATPLQGGLRVRDIKVTRSIDPITKRTIVTPVRDANGQEIELSAVVVPLHIEGADGTPEERAAAINGFVADIQRKGADVALVRAAATINGQDPAAAEATFTATQEAGAAQAAQQVAEVAQATPVQPGGLS